MLPILALLSASLIWGATAPIMKWTFQEVPPFTVAFLRFAVASLLIIPFVAKSLKIEKKDFGKILAAALLGTTINIIFFFLGLKLTLAINAALIIATIPIFTVLAAAVFLKEKLELKFFFSIGVAAIGLVLILGPPILTFGPNHLIGGLFLIIATLSWVGFEVLSKKLFLKYKPVTVTSYSIIIGTVTFLPLFVLDLLFIDPGWPARISLQGITGIAYGTLFSSIVAYFSWQWGLSKLAATEAGFFFYLNPISAVLVSIILLGEKVSPLFIAGSTLIAVSLILAEYKRKTHPLHQSAT